MDIVTTVMNTITAAYSNAASNTSSYLYNIPLSFSHTEGDTLPNVTYNIISTPNFYSMNSAGNKANKYMVSRIQFSVFCNEDQSVQGRNIADAITDLYSWAKFSNTGHNFMAMYPDNEGITFFDKDNKIYAMNHDFRVWVGD